MLIRNTRIMTKKNLTLIRQQLDEKLKKFKVLQELNPPRKGWLRVVRNALGMNGRQFAARMGVSPARISKLESNELEGAVTLKSLRRAAEALDCTLFYGLVPNKSLEHTVKKQIARYAKERFDRISQTMALEDQELTLKEKKEALKSLEEELLHNMPKKLWDK